MVVPQHISDAFERGEATVDDVRALLDVEARSQGWTLEHALAWADSDAAPTNYIQTDIKALASLLDLCHAA